MSPTHTLSAHLARNMIAAFRENKRSSDRPRTSEYLSTSQSPSESGSDLQRAVSAESIGQPASTIRQMTSKFLPDDSRVFVILRLIFSQCNGELRHTEHGDGGRCCWGLAWTGNIDGGFNLVVFKRAMDMHFHG